MRGYNICWEKRGEKENSIHNASLFNKAATRRRRRRSRPFCYFQSLRFSPSTGMLLMPRVRSLSLSLFMGTLLLSLSLSRRVRGDKEEEMELSHHRHSRVVGGVLEDGKIRPGNQGSLLRAPSFSARSTISNRQADHLLNAQ